MTCIKTGAQAYLEDYDEYVYGDAFAYGDVFFMRVVTRSREPIMPKTHFQVKTVRDWFDKDQHADRISNLFAYRTAVIDYGYEGVYVE
jgi:hypothetical protein